MNHEAPVKQQRPLLQSDTMVCPACGSRVFIWDPDSGEVVCGNCGLVITDPIVDTGPEWRAFTPEEKESRSRVGLPSSPSFSYRGLSTNIRVSRDVHGSRLLPEKWNEMSRLRRLNKRASMGSNGRNLNQALQELRRLSYVLHLPRPVRERSAMIYRKALKMGLVRGRSIDGVAAASLYAALRITRTPRTLSELAEQSEIEKREIGRYYRVLRRELNLHMPVPNPQDRVPKIASKAGIGEECQHIAVKILREAQRLKKTAGMKPMGLAAAALYLACDMNGEHRTQEAIAAAAGVTEVTIRNRYKPLVEAFKGG